MLTIRASFRALFILVLSCFSQLASSAVVFEKVGIVENTVGFVESFTLSQDHSVTLTLTDFSFNQPFQYLGARVTSATDLYASVDIGSLYDGIATDQSLWGDNPERSLGLSDSLFSNAGLTRQKTQQFELSAGTYYLALSAKVGPSWAFSDGSFGLYGIELATAAPVPVPASVVFFGSGLALLNLIRTRRKVKQ